MGYPAAARRKSVNCSPKDPGRFLDKPDPELHDLDVDEVILGDDFAGSLDLGVDAIALQKDQLTAGLHERHGQGNEFGKSTHRPSRGLIKPGRDIGFLGTRAHDLDIRKPESICLRAQPVGPAFHWFDEDERRIRACGSKHEAGEASTRTDVSHAARDEKGSKKPAVDHMPRPEPRKLQRADEAELFTELSQVCGELTYHVDSITEEDLGGRGLDLQIGRRSGHERISHINTGKWTD